jgi:PKHD-type hydroxylase
LFHVNKRGTKIFLQRRKGLRHHPKMNSLHLDRPAAFTAAECEAIVALTRARTMEPATVYGSGGDEVAPALRRAERCYLSRAESPAWLFERLDALFAESAAHFDLQVEPVFEAIQVVRYGLGDHFQSWHSDAGTDRHYQRQVSLSVELSDPADHEGGVLEIAPGTVGAARTLPRGGVRLFPSRAIHRVTPVTRGERWALVAWTGVQEPPR